MFPLCYRVRPRSSIYSKAKKRVRGTESPFITGDSLLRVYSQLFGPKSVLGKNTVFHVAENKHVEVKYAWVGTLMQLVAYIGPRSGLWYVKSDVRGYLRGWDSNLYQKI